MKSEAVSSRKAHFSLGRIGLWGVDIPEIGSPILPIIDLGDYELVKNDLGLELHVNNK